MDKPFDPLQPPLAAPHIRAIGPERPLQWLQRGWEDLRANLGASLPYGVILAAIGYLILARAADRPYLFMAAISGFMLIGPLAAAGIYEISRRHERGERISFTDSLRAIARNADSIAFFGAFLALVLLAWERLSAILFALFHRGEVNNTMNFIQGMFSSGDELYFLFAYLLVGAVLALVVFALSVVSIPMLMDRETDAVTAALTSLRALQRNFDALMLWAVMIVALMLIGFASMMIGMVILLPLLGHASWHAYKDLVR